jgi:hypothetical protein
MLQQFTQLRLHFFLNPGHMWMMIWTGWPADGGRRRQQTAADRPMAAAALL